ncbi:MAG: LemA family protein, partial [Pontimonas sp.]|nr:LemA family protein [Pontimonas sp.]
IPNLIETVKGYAAHESKVFEDVTKARAATLSAGDPGAAAEAENMMQSALKSIFAVAEAYPQLQASQNFLQLQAELVDTEDIAQVRVCILMRESFPLIICLSTHCSTLS